MDLDHIARQRERFGSTEVARLRAQCRRLGHAWVTAGAGIDGGRYCARCLLIEGEPDEPQLSPSEPDEPR